MRKTGTVWVAAVLATAAAASYGRGDTETRAHAASRSAPVAYDQAGAQGTISNPAATGIVAGSDTSRVDVGVPAIAGGVGINARAMLSNEALPDHNLKMVFSLNTGNYVADVQVKVSDSAGRTVLEGISDGPWLYAKLPPGNYTTEASYGGHTATQRFSVGSSGHRTAYFRWPASVERQVAANADVDQILGTGPQEPRR